MRGGSVAIFAGFLVLWGPTSRAQSAAPQRFFSLSAGMGISAFSSPSTADYINSVLQLREQDKIGEFSTAIEFFASPELQISDDWSVALEYSYLVKSYHMSSAAGPGYSDFSTTIHMPTLVAHYLIGGQGFWVKLGGGIGYYLGTFSQSLFGSGQTQEFTASSPGMKLEAVGNTMFDESFYGYIALDTRWAFKEAFSQSDGTSPAYQGTAPSLGFLDFGLKLGVAIYL
jgi:hypothetical protein